MTRHHHLALIVAIALPACLPATAAFRPIDHTYRPRPRTGFVEIYVDEAPTRKYRVVGTIETGYIANHGRAPVIAAAKARQYGCDLITTELVGAVAAAPREPMFRLASWSGSGSGGSGGSWGSSGGGSWSGGSSGGGHSSSSRGSTTASRRPTYYCGIYVEPPPPPPALVTPTTLI